MPIRAIVIDPRDDVAIVVEAVRAGETIEAQSAPGARLLVARADIPAGHKVALRDIMAGQPVLKYGEKIGLALRDIVPGDHVHIHNLAGDRVKLSVP